MEQRPFVAAGAAPVGALLREWRASRRWSQLDLALEAGLSTRHLSFIETGKSQPSRDTVLRLADTLDMPLRERNSLLNAAGYAPIFSETPLDTPQLSEVRSAINLILAQQEPYPAFLLNRHWDVLQANDAAMRVGAFLMQGRTNLHSNMLHQVFDPNDLRPAFSNWEEIAGDLIRHLHDAIAATPSDERARTLLDEILTYPGVPDAWRMRELGRVPAPLLHTGFRVNGQELRFFSTFTIFGATRDVTIDELHIECCFPGDEATKAFCQALANKGSR
jgi:transcriptional regulator with XRE-family HTH domain